MEELFMVTMSVSATVATCIVAQLIEKRIMYGKEDIIYRSLVGFSKKALPISLGITATSIAILKYVFHVS